MPHMRSGQASTFLLLAIEFGPFYLTFVPFLTGILSFAISGKLEPGSRLSIEVAPAGKTHMRFSPVVIGIDSCRGFQWRGKVFMRGILDSEHSFALSQQSNDTVRFSQGEVFSGMLIPFVAGSLAATKLGFEAMNVAL